MLGDNPMANAVCCEDRTADAIGCCFCRLPLPRLCEEHLSKHCMLTDDFYHFHLPLSAAEELRTKEQRERWKHRLLDLHSAYTALREVSDCLQLLKERVEAVRQELVNEIDGQAAAIKAQINAALKDYEEEMHAAIQETSSRALEEWTPTGGSLSCFVWDYNAEKPTGLLMSHYDVVKTQMPNVMKLVVKTCIPSLKTLQFEGDDNGPKNQWEEQLARSELLRQENAQLLKKCQENSDALEGLRTQLRVIAADCVAIAQGEKAKGTYQNCVEELTRGWEFLQKCGEEEATVKLGLELGEVLALHLSRLPEAREVVERAKFLEFCIRGYSQNFMVLENLGAVLAFESGEYVECEFACTQILSTYFPYGYSAELYWKAQLYYVLALHHQRKREVMLDWWNQKQGRATMLAELIEKCAKGVGARVAERYQEAEEMLKEAQKFATQYFPTSIYFAICSFHLASIYTQTNRTPLAHPLLSSAESMLSVHYPGSLYRAVVLTYMAKLCEAQKALGEAERLRLQANYVLEILHPECVEHALNLSRIADIYKSTGMREKALEQYAAANSVFQKIHPGDINYPLNLIYMANYCKEIGLTQEAIDWRMEADRVLTTCHRDTSYIASNQCNLGLLYNSVGRVEDAENSFVAARARFAANNLTSHDAACNLCHLARLLDAKKKTGEALQAALEALQIWTTLRASKEVATVQAMVNVLKKKAKKQKILQ